jgi:hypothetical protein
LLNGLFVFVVDIVEVRAITELVLAEGLDSPRFASVYDAQDHFLKMEPSLDMAVWPMHLQRQRHCIKVRGHSEPSGFWRAVSTSALKSVDFTPDEIKEQQYQFISEKVVQCIKNTDVGVSRSKVSRFRAIFCSIVGCL